MATTSAGSKRYRLMRESAYSANIANTDLAQSTALLAAFTGDLPTGLYRR
jgi:hypothetical protein